MVPYEAVLAAFELDEIKMMNLSYGYAEKDMIFFAMIAAVVLLAIRSNKKMKAEYELKGKKAEKVAATK